MLFHPDEAEHVAQYLADEIAKYPGTGPKKRDGIVRDLEKALRRTSADLALSSHRMLSARVDDESVTAALNAFGYKYTSKPKKGGPKEK